MALTLFVAQLELENNLHSELGTLSAAEHPKLRQTLQEKWETMTFFKRQER